MNQERKYEDIFKVLPKWAAGRKLLLKKLEAATPLNRFIIKKIYSEYSKKGIWPAELARRSGVRYGTLSKFEVGRTETLSMKNIAKVASGLGMTVSEFFEGLEDEPGYSEYIVNISTGRKIQNKSVDNVYRGVYNIDKERGEQ